RTRMPKITTALTIPRMKWRWTTRAAAMRTGTERMVGRMGRSGTRILGRIVMMRSLGARWILGRRGRRMGSWQRIRSRWMVMMR
ncbi:hypothetical protein LTR33_015304, partial [Friedmanniomyces endolithicus]